MRKIRHIRITKIKRLSACVLLMILCRCSSSDKSEPVSWETSEISNDLDNEIEMHTDYEIKSCSDLFIMGPVWHNIPNKLLAIQESEWIASITTSKWYLSRGNTIDYDYGDKINDIYKVAAEENVSIIKNQKNETVLVKGRPHDILKLIEKSCDILSLDLTGINCDCNPDECERARACNVTARPLQKNIFRSDYDNLVLPYSERTYFGCSDDSFVSQTNSYEKDYRGVYWLVERVKSWEKSNCKVDHE